MSTITHDPAAEAYATLAPFYDLFTAGHRHDLWLRRLERIALACGLRGRRALDVARGTGKSLAPLLELGYDATGCDLAPEMLDVARRRLPEGVELHAADMRELPAL